jgi:putative ABC transport system permease protein
MFSNYLKVALRNIRKHKFFAAINILGMTVGITACLLIILYVKDELSYDRFHTNARRMYQVGLHGKIGGQDVTTANTCPPLAAAMVAEIPEVESATRIGPFFGQIIVKLEDRSFLEERIFFADSNFFDFFSFRLLEGNPKTVLKEPNTVVLTEKMVKKYFGDGPALGKLLVIGNDNKSYKVTGIAEEAPPNSHFHYNFLVSAVSSESMKTTVWLNNFMYNYFILRENASLPNVDKKLGDLVVKYVGPEVEKFLGTSLKQLHDSGGQFGYYTTLVTDLHLHSKSLDGLEPGGNILYVYSFGVIAIFIMIIACINFMNMSTARSTGRAKEVGLRKTLGSLREQMIAQFLAESMLYSALSMVLALIATYLLLPAFNLLAGKELNIQALLDLKFILGIIGVTLFVGLAAGSYPAFYLTSFSVVEVLKGKIRAGLRSQGARSVLVVFQFAISIFLIIATVIVFNQLNFMQERDLGLDKHNVIYLYNIDRLGNNREPLRNAIGSRSDVTGVSFTNNSFPGVNNTTVFKAPGSDQDHIMGLYTADYDHQAVMKFKLAEGRFFSRDFPSDTSAIVLNEAAVKEFGWSDPLREEVLYNTGGSAMRHYKVIGVLRDFNFESLKEKVRPISIMLSKNDRVLAVRYQGNSRELTSGLESIWKKFSNGEPFQYRFLDQNYDELFRSEQRLGKIFTVFAGLAIFIACLGLFALAAFTAEQRTKEIGIRKALGATVPSLTLMISKEFILLVVIAFALVVIPTWFAVNWWLESFAYRIPVNPLVFLMSGAAAILIAWLTVSYQSLKAASTDPVSSLRYE